MQTLLLIIQNRFCWYCFIGLCFV